MTRPINVLIAVLCVAACVTANAADPQPLIVAHRGLLRHAPENTLANFRACLELRIGFEFDVEQTKDGHLVCIHDNTVDRTTNGTGKVADLTLTQIRELDAGSWFDPKFADEKVPTVDEVLQLVSEYRKHDVLVAVDLKAENVGQDVVRLAEKHEVLERLLFIGRTITAPELRKQIKDASPKAHTAAVANNAGEFADALASPNADWVYVRFLPSEEQIEAVHQAKKRAFIAGLKRQRQRAQELAALRRRWIGCNSDRLPADVAGSVQEQVMGRETRLLGTDDEAGRGHKEEGRRCVSVPDGLNRSDTMELDRLLAKHDIIERDLC